MSRRIRGVNREKHVFWVSLDNFGSHRYGVTISGNLPFWDGGMLGRDSSYFLICSTGSQAIPGVSAARLKLAFFGPPADYLKGGKICGIDG